MTKIMEEIISLIKSTSIISKKEDNRFFLKILRQLNKSFC